MGRISHAATKYVCVRASPLVLTNSTHVCGGGALCGANVCKRVALTSVAHTHTLARTQHHHMRRGARIMHARCDHYRTPALRERVRTVNNVEYSVKRTQCPRLHADAQSRAEPSTAAKSETIARSWHATVFFCSIDVCARRFSRPVLHKSLRASSTFCYSHVVVLAACITHRQPATSSSLMVRLQRAIE